MNLEKTCAVCGRRIEWRKKWERTWNEIKFCSDKCRSNRLSEVDHKLEQAVETLLSQRGTGKTICPSEAAKLVAGSDGEWKQLMEPARSAARRLVAKGSVVISQGGVVVDSSTAKGPIRIRKK